MSAVDLSIQPGAASPEACLAVTLRFFEGLDRHHAQTSLECFAADGVWHRGASSLTGHEAILAALDQRPPTRRTAHVVSNARITAVGEGAAEVDFLLVAYEGDGPAGGGAPAGHFAGARLCKDRLCWRDGAWKITDKSSTALLAA